MFPGRDGPAAGECPLTMPGAGKFASYPARACGTITVRPLLKNQMVTAVAATHQP